jgi:hypothetical protein
MKYAKYAKQNLFHFSKNDLNRQRFLSDFKTLNPIYMYMHLHINLFSSYNHFKLLKIFQILILQLLRKRQSL